MNMFSDPQKIIIELPIFSGQRVADFGAGTGVYTFLLAQKVKGIQDGEVFAIDVNQGLVERIGSEAREQGLTNVHPIWGDVDEPRGSNLADASVQAVLIANTLFQVEHRAAVIQEAHRILSFEGTLVLIDWEDSFQHIGPHADHVITKESARLLLQENGFDLVREFDAGAHHYGLIARKHDSVNK